MYKYLAFLLTVAMAFATSTAGAFAVTGPNNPIIIPAECGDSLTTAGFVSSSGFPLAATAGEGVAGGVIVQPNFTDITDIANLAPLPKGNLGFTTVLNQQTGTPLLLIEVAYTFVNGGGTTISAISLLPTAAVDGNIATNTKLLKGKQLQLKITADTNLFNLRTVLTNNIGENPNVDSTNFQLRGIAPLVTNTGAAGTQAIAYANNFALNVPSALFPPVDNQTNVTVNKSTSNLNCSSFATLQPVLNAVHAAALTSVK
ncbi:MAG TPA: hypothetical protein V6C89_03540 [Drouetiella sp.]|jgi:hypothetical protein